MSSLDPRGPLVPRARSARLLVLVMLSGCAATVPGAGGRKLVVSAGRGDLGGASVVCESLSARSTSIDAGPVVVDAQVARAEAGAALVELSMLVVSDCATTPGLHISVHALGQTGKRTLVPPTLLEGVTLEPGKPRVLRSPAFPRPPAQTPIEVIVDGACRDREPVQGVGACVLS